MESKQLIDKAKSEGRTLLTEIESKVLLKQAGISIIDTKLATSKRDAIALSQHLGFPVVLKIVSPDIIHKSDAGGVKLDLRTVTQVSKAYDDILKTIRSSYAKAKIHGISIQKMARPGVEIIIGMSKDSQFGPVLMFGLGGVFVEVLKDVSFRIIPLTNRDAHTMIRDIKGFPILNGYRGQEPVNVKNLEDTLLKASHFIEKHPMVKELDINPVFAYSNSAIAADARIILESK